MIKRVIHPINHRGTYWLIIAMAFIVVLALYIFMDQESQPLGIVAKDRQPTIHAVTEKTLPNQAIQTEKIADDYFIEYKLQRDANRSQKFEQFAEILSSNATAEVIAQTKVNMDQLQEMEDVELQLEELVKSEGFADAVVLTKEDRATVIVKSAALDRAKAVKIIQLVSNHLNIPANSVMISFKE
jgi:stage III sporulation protein AH